MSRIYAIKIIEVEEAGGFSSPKMSSRVLEPYYSKRETAVAMLTAFTTGYTQAVRRRAELALAIDSYKKANPIPALPMRDDSMRTAERMRHDAIRRRQEHIEYMTEISAEDEITDPEMDKLGDSDLMFSLVEFQLSDD